MSIQKRPFLIAAVAGAAIQIILGIISQVVNVLTFDLGAVIGPGGQLGRAAWDARQNCGNSALLHPAGNGSGRRIPVQCLIGREETIEPGQGTTAGTAARVVSQLFTGCVGIDSPRIYGHTRNRPQF